MALARALARRPRVLLLDEPLAALDRRLRSDTQFELKAVQARLGTTFLVVTHDQDEAMSLADRMAILRAGRVVQVGTPRAIYDRPADRWTADFLGDVNLLRGSVTAVVDGFAVVALDAGVAVRAGTEAALGLGAEAWVAVRPERLHLAAEAAADAIPGEVAEVGYLGDRTVWRIVGPNGLVLRASAPNTGAATPGLGPGARVFARFDAAAAVVLAQ